MSAARVRPPPDRARAAPVARWWTCRLAMRLVGQIRQHRPSAPRMSRVALGARGARRLRSIVWLFARARTCVCRRSVSEPDAKSSVSSSVGSGAAAGRAERQNRAIETQDGRVKGAQNARGAKMSRSDDRKCRSHADKGDADPESRERFTSTAQAVRAEQTAWTWLPDDPRAGSGARPDSPCRADP